MLSLSSELLLEDCFIIVFIWNFDLNIVRDPMYFRCFMYVIQACDW